MANEKVAVTISRHWDSPQIHTVVSGDGIALAILLDDYVKALTAELYEQGRWMTKAQLDQKVQACAQIILGKIKEESAKAV